MKKNALKLWLSFFATGLVAGGLGAEASQKPIEPWKNCETIAAQKKNTSEVYATFCEKNEKKYSWQRAFSAIQNESIKDFDWSQVSRLDYLKMTEVSENYQELMQGDRWDFLSRILSGIGYSKTKIVSPSLNRFLIRVFPCSDGGHSAAIIFHLINEFKKSPEDLFNLIDEESRLVVSSKAKDQCTQSLQKGLGKNPHPLATSIAAGMTEYYSNKAQVDKDLQEFWKKIQDEVGKKESLKPFLAWYENLPDY